MTIRSLAYALVGVTALTLPAQAADIVIGSSSVGGSYYLYAGGLSTYLTENTENIQATARTTRGSVENARLIDRGALDFAFANGTVIAQQKAGVDQFEDAQSDNIRGIAVVDRSPSHWVALQDSGLETPMDLAGQRVSIGAAGSGGANNAMIVLQELGIWDDVVVQNLGFSESANNLRDGNLEAFIGGSALPMPAVLDIATTHDITLLPFTEEFIEQLQAREPAIERFVIPAGTYDGVDEDILTMANASTFFTHAEMDEELVYELVSAMLTEDSGDYMRSIYSAWDPDPGLELWERVGVPLHPGAERAYREAGLID